MKKKNLSTIKHIAKRKGQAAASSVYPLSLEDAISAVKGEDYYLALSDIPTEEQDMKIQEWEEFKKQPRHNFSGSSGIIKT